MSVVNSTPSFIQALTPIAKENHVSNKAKQAAKAKHAKEIDTQNKLAAKMDKQLTKLEKIADKESAKQAKEQAKLEKAAAKEAKKMNKSKESKAAAKEQAKLEKTAAKEQAKLEKTAAKEHAKEQAKEQAKLEKAATIRLANTATMMKRIDIIKTIHDKLGGGDVCGEALVPVDEV